MRVAREGAVRVTIQFRRTGLPGVGRVGRQMWLVRKAKVTKKFINGRIRGSRTANIVLRHRGETVLPTIFWIGLSFRGRGRILGFSFRRRILGRLLIGIVRSIGGLGMSRIRRRVRRRLVVERMAVILRR